MLDYSISRSEIVSLIRLPASNVVNHYNLGCATSPLAQITGSLDSEYLCNQLSEGTSPPSCICVVLGECVRNFDEHFIAKRLIRLIGFFYGVGRVDVTGEAPFRQDGELIERSFGGLPSLFRQRVLDELALEALRIRSSPDYFNQPNSAAAKVYLHNLVAQDSTA